MKTSNKISEEEQAGLDKINQAEFEKTEKETTTHPKKSKNKAEVVGEGYTDGAGNFIPADKQGNLSDAYKDRIKGMKPYKRFSDGTVEIG